MIQTKEWISLGKSIANLYRYVEIRKLKTKRYLAAMPEIDTDKVPEKETIDVSTPKERNTRRYSGLIYYLKKTLQYYLL